MAEVVPLDPIGAEVREVDLREPVSGSDWMVVRRALFDHGVLVFRDQPVTDDQLAAFASRFGPLEDFNELYRMVNDAQAGDTYEDSRVIVMSNLDAKGQVLDSDNPVMVRQRANERWHTDSSNRPNPSSVSVLTGRVVPPVGGDTFFASMRRGWEDLPPAHKEGLRGLVAVHDFAKSVEREGGMLDDELVDAIPPVAHPIVRTHPDAGFETLYVSNNAAEIEGWSEDEGRKLIERLLAWCTRPGHVYRHKWSEHDVVAWDNRSMLHRAEGFDGVRPRVIHRATVKGNWPDGG